MYPEFIKYYTIFFFNIYISMKLLNQKTKSIGLNAFVFVFTFILTIITNILSSNLATFSHFVPLLLLWIFMSFYTSRPQIAFIVVILSFGISYGIHAFSSFISTLLIYILARGASNFSFLAVSIFATLFHTFISLALLQTKRLQKGLPLTHLTNYINISTLLCLLFIAVPTHSPSSVDPSWQHVLSLITPVALLAFLIYWWQAQITKSYRRSLELRELESLRTELAEKNADIQKIMKENERVRFINHRDNNLLSAMEYSVNNYLVTDFTNKETAIAKRDELLQELNKIRGNRASSYHNQETEVVTFNTGSSLLNTLLIHMNREAAKDNILFTVHQSTELDNFIPREISEEDLVHLVDDLLKNAFIAVKDCEVRMVQLQFYKWNKHLVVEVADSGIPFEVKSIVNMGITELTTHADTGGSGIGLVDIWNTKENCKATYHMEEYATPAPFSKKISLTFDKKNRYSVRTWRKDEILQMSKRADLQVYGE